MSEIAAAGAVSAPAGVRRRVQRILADVAAEEGTPPTVRWLGPEDAATLLDPAAEASADVVVAHDVVSRVADAEAAVAALLQRTRRHLVLTAPREPLAPVGVTVTGRLLGGRRTQRFSTPDLVRLASTAGAVRATHLPPPWTVLWVRRT